MPLVKRDVLDPAWLNGQDAVAILSLADGDIGFQFVKPSRAYRLSSHGLESTAKRTPCRWIIAPKSCMG